MTLSFYAMKIWIHFISVNSSGCDHCVGMKDYNELVIVSLT